MSPTATVERPFRADLLTVDPPRLLGSRCTACGTTTFPPRGFCPGCRAGGELETVPLATEGRVCSFTVVRQAPPGVEVPYVLAQVDLPADEVRLLSTVVGVAPDEVELEQPVDLELHPVGAAEDDATLLGYRFRARPAEVSA